MYGFGGRVRINEKAPTKPRAEKVLPPTPEMRILDAAMATLSLISPADSTLRKCFCEGACLLTAREHPAAPYHPLCHACGLILCTALRPEPIAPGAQCPSCEALLMRPDARAQLHAALAAERARLAAEQLDHRDTQAAIAAPVTPVAPAAAAPAPARRTLRIDGKTHKVTASVRKTEKGRVDAPTILDDDAQDVGDDDAARTDAIRVLPVFPYIEPQFRPSFMMAVESETNTEIPDLELILQSKPVGSSADTQLRQRQRAAASATARSRGRKSGKSGRAR